MLIAPLPATAADPVALRSGFLLRGDQRVAGRLVAGVVRG